MSANAETQTPQQPVNERAASSSVLLLLLTLLFIIIAVAKGFIGFLVICVISKKPMTHTWQGIRFKLCLRCLAA